MKLAVLFHVLEWRSELTHFDMDGGVSLHRTTGTQVEKLYHHLCEINPEMHDEHFNFPSHLLLSDSAIDESLPDFGGPYSTISRCCNIIAICTSYPLGMCRLILSKDNFDSALISTVAYEQTPQMEILRGYPDYLTVSGNKEQTIISSSNSHFPALDDVRIKEISTCWNNLIRLFSCKQANNHRIDNALSYFFYAWRSYYMEHVCLNLAIVLETLFSPSSQNELSHRIAFNVCRFCGETRDDRESIYKTIRDFYSVRSSIVHGGKAKERDLYSLTPKVFQLCTRILKRVLYTFDTALCFSRETERRRLFSKWLFDK